MKTELNLNTYIIIISLLISVSVNSTEWKDFARKQFVSWEELQTKEIYTESKNEFNLSESCPKSLMSLKIYKSELKHSYIYFTDYYWTEYINEHGLKCIVKFSDSDRSDSSAEILTESQSQKLLTAEELYGITEEGKQVLNAHVNLQRLAIRDLESLKYGGSLHIIKFMKKNPKEIKSNFKSKLEITIDGYAVAQTLSPIEILESSYRKATLDNIKKEVQDSPPNKMSNGKYPLLTIEELINEAKQDIQNGLTTYLDVWNDY